MKDAIDDLEVWKNKLELLILSRRSASFEKNIGLTVVPKDIQFIIVLFLHTYFSALLENVVNIVNKKSNQRVGMFNVQVKLPLEYLF
jgi:hypothetical protein